MLFQFKIPSFHQTHISRIHQLMRTACSEAVKYGEALLPDGQNNRRVVVILNPTANKRAAEKAFEKYCGPVLFLAGIRVDIVKTESEGFARTYVESVLKELPDAILVAGGDGTLSEVLTGLSRRGVSHLCPLGVLPLGRTNSVAGRLFDSDGGRLGQVQQLTDASLAIIRGSLQKMDIMKIEILPEAGDAEDSVAKKPIYAMGSIKWGAFRDAMALRDKYWYYGGLREKAAILFNAYRTSRLNWNCNGVLTTTPACEGCTNCYEKPQEAPKYKSKNWWGFMVPSSSKKETGDAVIVNGQDVRTRFNPECGVRKETTLEETGELYLTTANVDASISEAPARINLRLGSANVNKMDWIQDGWRRTENDLNSKLLDSPVGSRTVELQPKQNNTESGPDTFYSIDNEAFEVKPIRVTLLPKYIHMFV